MRNPFGGLSTPKYLASISLMDVPSLNTEATAIFHLATYGQLKSVLSATFNQRQSRAVDELIRG
jgi:hypothetical protein